ncbi:MAG: lysophospholipid acyltransferase family protein [Opitutales bacterium]|jgi:1-acyl-sn-glycerol-3-phosphate acyltransferase
MTSPQTEIPALYNTVRVIADWYFSTFYDYTLSGAQHVPQQGGLIFAANHISFYDPPAIGARIRRQISYFARDTLYKGWFGKGLLAIDTIPVARDNADVKSLKAIFKTLKKAGAVAIYPEGTRSADGQLAEPKPGAGMIACKSGAIVIPTRIFGTYEAFGRQHKRPTLGGPIHIAYGRPMTAAEIDPGKDHPERYLEASRRIMARIAALQPPNNLVV